MAMNDEETVALIVGGHTFGKTPRRGQPRPRSARSPRPPRSSSRASAGRTASTAARAPDTLTSGLEGAWTKDADQVGQRLPREPVRVRVGADREPGRRQAVDADERRRAGHGARRPRPVEAPRADDADDGPGAEGRPGLRADLRGASTRTPTSSPRPSPRPGTSCCTATWARCRATSARGSPEPQLWQDPVPAVDHELIDDADVAALKEKILGLGPVDLPAGRHRVGVGGVASAAPTSAAGRNGARIRLAPQKDWEVNEPAELAEALATLEQIQQDFNGAQPAASRSRSPT